MLKRYNKTIVGSQKVTSIVTFWELLSTKFDVTTLYCIKIAAYFNYVNYNARFKFFDIFVKR